MKPLIPLLLLAVLVLASAGCVQPQIPEPYPTPVPTVQPASAEESAFWISNTDQYLSYWNEKMGWNFTEQTLAGYSYVTNNSEFLHAVEGILGLTEEQFDAFVTADAAQKKTDQIEHHSQSSRLSEISADQI